MVEASRTYRAVALAALLTLAGCGHRRVVALDGGPGADAADAADGADAAFCTPVPGCSAPRWIEDRPAGKQVTFISIWGSGPCDVFAVGSGGTIVHFDGTRWATMASPTKQGLYGVGGSGPGNVLAVGAAGTIIRYDGSSWTAVPSGTNRDLHDVFVLHQSMAVAVGQSGTIWIDLGQKSWSTTSGTQSLYGAWGFNMGNLYAVGTAGTILYADGQKWTRLDTGGLVSELRGVWGSGPTDLYAVGEHGVILRSHDGKTWHATYAKPPLKHLGAVWGSGASDVWVVGGNAPGQSLATIHRYDGSQWQTMNQGDATAHNAVWGSGPRDVFVASGGGAILHYTCRK